MVKVSRNIINANMQTTYYIRKLKFKKSSRSIYLIYVKFFSDIYIHLTISGYSPIIDIDKIDRKFISTVSIYEIQILMKRNFIHANLI